MLESFDSRRLIACGNWVEVLRVDSTLHTYSKPNPMLVKRKSLGGKQLPLERLHKAMNLEVRGFRRNALRVLPALRFLPTKRNNFGVNLFVSHPMMKLQQLASCFRPLS